MDIAQTTLRPRLRLADHVRTCVVDDQVVLLDLRRNRYLGIDMKQWRLIDGALDSPDQACGRGRSTSAERLVAPMLRRGLLTTEPPAPTSRQRMSLPPSPVVGMDARDTARDMGITSRRLFNFVAATTQAGMWLKCCSLLFIARQIEARHPKDEQGEPKHRSERLRNAVAVFERLRPLAFTARDRCLYDSIALMIFLAREDLSARWVVGVTTGPFRAHSWVQDADVVLNDAPESVRQFAPILVV